ncbi:hypothetical protein SAMD00023353_8100300 [Rosellinia necatrix]|uniref:Uncharacterized protein n=1 Tax=Rosellinia necatrix TaxID=77044 RepID=A0A1W2TV61_ROSNE|nr:hypothetical protein SAMD00023353_8100300 [Rosellinia necatrix]
MGILEYCRPLLYSVLRSYKGRYGEAVPALIRLLLEKGADPDYEHEACGSPPFAAARCLVDPYNIYVSSSGRDPTAARERDPTPKVFHIANPFRKTPMPIPRDCSEAPVHGDPFWERDGNGGEAGSTPLQLPTRDVSKRPGAWEIMIHLLASGARIDTQPEPDISPLHTAVASATGTFFTEDDIKDGPILLEFLLEKYKGGPLSSRYLGNVFRACNQLQFSDGGREVVGRLLLKHGASWDY